MHRPRQQPAKPDAPIDSVDELRRSPTETCYSCSSTLAIKAPPPSPHRSKKNDATTQANVPQSHDCTPSTNAGAPGLKLLRTTLGWGKIGLRARGGGSFEPFSRNPPPFWAPVMGTPDGLMVTPNRLTGKVGGGPEVPQHI